MASCKTMAWIIWSNFILERTHFKRAKIKWHCRQESDLQPQPTACNNCNWNVVSIAESADAVAAAVRIFKVLCWTVRLMIYEQLVVTTWNIIEVLTKTRNLSMTNYSVKRDVYSVCGQYILSAYYAVDRYCSSNYTAYTSQVVNCTWPGLFTSASRLRSKQSAVLSTLSLAAVTIFDRQGSCLKATIVPQ